MVERRVRRFLGRYTFDGLSTNSHASLLIQLSLLGEETTLQECEKEYQDSQNERQRGGVAHLDRSLCPQRFPINNEDRGQRCAQWTSLSSQIDLIEHLQGTDRAQHHHQQDDGPQERQGDLPKLLPASGAINRGG